MSDNGSRPDFGLGSNGDIALSERVQALRLDNRTSAKKETSGNSWLPWVLCALLAGSWATIGVRSYRGNGGLATAPTTNTPIVQTPTNTPSTTPETPMAPTAAPGESVLVSKGSIIPAHLILISPVEVFGRIIKLNIEEGKHFEKGEILAVIDATSYRADYDESVAAFDASQARYTELRNGARKDELEQMDAEMDEVRALIKQYALEYQRNKDLSGGALARRDFELAESNFLAGQAKLRKLDSMKKLLQPRPERVLQAQAEMRGAEARVARAKFRLDNCEIRAPVSGTILTKKAEIGNLINPVVGGSSVSLCEMADLSDMEMDLDIQERDISKVFVGQLCDIRADAYPNRKYAGRVDRVMPTAKRAGGVLPTRVKIIIPKAEQGKYLKPEMGATVTFLNQKADK